MAPIKERKISTSNLQYLFMGDIKASKEKIKEILEVSKEDEVKSFFFLIIINKLTDKV